MTAILKRLFIPNSTDQPIRRYDLDWLRVLLFALLIFYHAGMLYVAGWGYHVKSQYTSEWLAAFMLIANPWRMALLWLISGIAIRFILTKVSVFRFVVLRSYRLLLPLLFAILVIIPPQLYVEMTNNGDLMMSYWAFYQAFFDINSPIFVDYQAGIWPHIDVNHLWYLRELWQFSLYLLCLLPVLNSPWITKLIDYCAQLPGLIAIALFSMPFMLVKFLGADSRELLGFICLIYGYVIGWHPIIWQRLKDNAHQLLIVAIVSYAVLLMAYWWIYLPSSTNSNSWLLVVARIIHALDRVFWMLAILALSVKYLNHKSENLAYLSDAVYPFYILHQTLIIVLCYQLTQYQLGPWLEPIIVITATFVGCCIGYELIRRTNILRPLFGLKINVKLPTPVQYSLMISVGCILVIFGLEILL